MEAISGRKTIQEIAADHSIHPIQVSQWKRQLLDGASELFNRGKKAKDKGEGLAKEAELFQQIGRLQMELEWLKKISASVMHVNCDSWSTTTTPSSASAAHVCCWACLDPRSTTVLFGRGRQPSLPHPADCVYATQITFYARALGVALAQKPFDPHESSAWSRGPTSS